MASTYLRYHEHSHTRITRTSRPVLKHKCGWSTGLPRARTTRIRVYVARQPSTHATVAASQRCHNTMSLSCSALQSLRSVLPFGGVPLRSGNVAKGTQRRAVKRQVDVIHREVENWLPLMSHLVCLMQVIGHNIPDWCPGALISISSRRTPPPRTFDILCCALYISDRTVRWR
ncbi:hypothetical protein P280DRAFT_79556 [Massarina eburnea CBS 473.64]|uniref:Uncharacterized protein n=1 Tax=Massarina eburnea CBS 473.64 TaxID=1395130 RepID=A0A6A6RS00_9PLEO|nr:hypothetical protein P280DRAFT_79556 [Massarina eburnea CBS 473.64]